MHAQSEVGGLHDPNTSIARRYHVCGRSLLRQFEIAVSRIPLIAPVTAECANTLVCAVSTFAQSSR